MDNPILQYLKGVEAMTIIINCFNLLLFLFNVSVSADHKNSEERGNRLHKILKITLTWELLVDLTQNEISPIASKP